MVSALIPTLFLLAQVATPPADPAVSAPPPAADNATATAPAPVNAPAQANAPAPATPPAAANGNLKPLSFFSKRFVFRWDQYLPLNEVVDGLKINSIFFNKRSLTFIKSAEFGTRAVVEVTNTAATKRVPGIAVAVFDAQDHLVGVASGGPKIGGVSAGTTESFDLSFHQVLERIPRADHFFLAVELSN